MAAPEYNGFSREQKRERRWEEQMNSNMLCSRCHKRLAVIYMTRMENGQTINEGL